MFRWIRQGVRYCRAAVLLMDGQIGQRRGGTRSISRMGRRQIVGDVLPEGQ